MKIDYFSRYLKYKQKYLELKGGAVNYYLYLTLEDEATPGLEWGGTHITIAGRGNSKEALKKISPNFDKGRPEWTLSSTSKLAIDQGMSALCFESGTLNALSQRLVREGIENVKGPVGNATHQNPWHISFPSNELDAKLAEFNAGFQYWHLTICTQTIEHGQSVFTWERLDEPNYFLYLTLEDNATPGQLWGGTHICITGRGNSKEALQRISPNFNSGSPEWTLSRTSNLAIDQGLNALRFDSGTLNTLSQQLVSEGVVNVKGPVGNAAHNNPWFIRFPPHEVLATKLAEFNAGYRMWHLTICTETITHGHSVFTWERLRSSTRRIGFDFDGVIHTAVDGNLWSRNPLSHNRRDNPCFQLICDKIRDRASHGYEIFIITARHSNSQQIIRDNLTHCGITPAMIPDSNIRTIGGQSKADLAIQLGLEEFHDDSQVQINDFMGKVQLLPSPFTLFKAFPESNAIQIEFQQ
jgi:hypothetical protein